MAKENIKSIWKKFKKILFPGFTCLVCDMELREPENCLCDDCLGALVPISGNICAVCGEPLPEPEQFCDICSENPRPFDMARSCFVYNDTSSKLVMGLKYAKRKYMIKFMARELLLKMADFGVLPDIVAPIPITASHKKTRGFNQCELLAEEMRKLSGNAFEVVPDLVIRAKDRPPQAGLTRAERLVNLDGTFARNKSINIKDKIILVLDDVFTTGSTISEASRVLRGGKPKGIFALTFAKTNFKQFSPYIS